MSAVQLGSISIESNICAFSFNEYDSVLLYFSSQLCYQLLKKSLNELQRSHVDIDAVIYFYKLG